jgi:uncharacterized RDD family membrane protein YckC
MNEASITDQSPQAGPPVYELSGWWLRAGAELIDLIIIAILAVTISAATGVNTDDSSDTDGGWALLIYGLAYLVVMTVVMGMSNGKTLGMMATNIRVVREDGAAIGFGYAFYRQFLIRGVALGIIGTVTLGLAYLVNYLWPIPDDNNQAGHDKICNTRVVRDRAAEGIQPMAPPQTPGQSGPPPQPTMPPPPPDTYQPPPGFENPVPED